MHYGEEGLKRFISAQERDYSTALSEIKGGRKRSHWMWYIFPQIQGLGMSSTAQYYGINGMAEAKEYMAQPYLKSNLIEISEALLALPGSNPSAVMGYPDDLKLCSCMTLFEAASPEEEVFGKVLDKYYNGVRDSATLRLLGAL